MPLRDTAQLGFAIAFRPTDHIVASTVRHQVAGKVTLDGPFYFGVLCNRLFHAPGDRGLLHVAKGGLLQLGGDIRIAGSARLEVTGELVIGSHTRIGVNARILATSHIAIGEGVAMGPECMILDSDLHGLAIGGEHRAMTAPVTIGDHVWIGSRCTFLKGAIVGEGSVVAAGSVVTGEIPPGVVAGGIPARVLATEAEWTP